MLTEIVFLLLTTQSVVEKLPPNTTAVEDVDPNFLTVDQLQELYADKGSKQNTRVLLEECSECKDLYGNQEIVSNKGNYLVRRSYSP